MFATFNGCAVIKLHFVKEAIESSSSLPFITNFNLFLNVKILTDYSTYFKDVIVNSVRVRLIEVYAEWGFVIEGNIRRLFRDPA